MYVPSKESQKCLPFDEIKKALDSREKLSAEAQQQDYARICAVNKIYAIPHDEMDGVLERIYNQYLAAYNAMKSNDKRRRVSGPLSFKRFWKDFKIKPVTLCARCKLCGTMNGWGGHYGVRCGMQDKYPVEHGWYGGCDLYEPIESKLVQVDLPWE